MPRSLYRLILALSLLLPFAAHASDAGDFVAAESSQRAELLEAWAAKPDPARVDLLIALEEGRVAADSSNRAFIQNGDSFTAADPAAPALADAPNPDEPQAISLNNRLRGLVDTALASHQLLAANAKLRLAAALTLQKSARPAQLQLLMQQVSTEKDEAVHSALTLALANLQLVDTSPSVRLAAVRLLGETGDPLARTRLENLLEPNVETDPSVRLAAETSLAQVKRKLMIGEVIGQVFSGISLGSDAAAGCAGPGDHLRPDGHHQHGARRNVDDRRLRHLRRADHVSQRYAPGALEFYLAGGTAGRSSSPLAVGMALERTVIRHLYGRPLETLLATWGISLMLMQLMRVVFGAQNVEVPTPNGCRAVFTVLPNLVLSVQPDRHHRLCAVRGGAAWLMLNKTRLGLFVRAVTQNRNMADCVRRAHRPHRHDDLRPRLRHRRPGRRGAVADGQCRP
jgi:urea transport system permease protein